jgi:hypothetical protein
MQKFWPLGGEIPILNVICAPAPNPVTAARFLYVENIVQTNLHRLNVIIEKKDCRKCRKLCFIIKKIEIFQYFHFICSLAPGVLFSFQLFDIYLKA